MAKGKKTTAAQPAAPAAVPTGTPVDQAQPATAPVQTAPVAETPAAAAAPATPAAPPKPAKVQQNGVTRPGEGTTTGRIWAISDSISAQLKAPAPRADVMKQAEAEEINAATAATQYGKWRKFNGLKAEPKAVAPAAPAVAPVAPPESVAAPVAPVAPAPVAG